MTSIDTLPGGCPKRRDDVVVKMKRGSRMALGPGPDARHALNDTAFALWELCDGETSPDEMVEAICTLFATSATAVAGDIARTLARFTELDLIEWSDPGP